MFGVSCGFMSHCAYMKRDCGGALFRKCHLAQQCLTIRCALEARPAVACALAPVLLAVSPAAMDKVVPLLLRGAAACTPPRGVPGIAALVQSRYVWVGC